MSVPSWRLILNGKAADDERVREAVFALRARGVDLGVRVTWESGDAERYVAEAVTHRADTVIAGGGDGTLSAVAAALAHRPEGAGRLPSLALLPLGTANDFAGAAGLPLEPLPALEAILQTFARPVDLLRIATADRTYWCANLASGGFGTRVTVETDEGLKDLLGGLAYLLTGIARLGRIEPQDVTLHGPGFAWAGPLIALGLGNARQAGGGQALCPDARVDDGLIDVTVVPDLAGELGATVGTLVTEGKLAALERVAVRARLPWVDLRAPDTFVLNLDGEPVESRHFRVACVPGRLRLHLPPDSPLLTPPAEATAPAVANATARVPRAHANGRPPLSAG